MTKIVTQPAVPAVDTQADRARHPAVAAGVSGGIPWTAVHLAVAQHKAEILERVARGERLADISQALSLGLDRRRLSELFLNDPDYKAAIEAGHSARLDRAEEMIEKADIDRSADVARARAYWAAVAWRAERECPARWGQRQQVGEQAQVVIQIGLQAHNSVRQIEGERAHLALLAQPIDSAEDSI